MWGISFIEDRDLIRAILLHANLRPVRSKFIKDTGLNAYQRISEVVIITVFYSHITALPLHSSRKNAISYLIIFYISIILTGKRSNLYI